MELIVAKKEKMKKVFLKQKRAHAAGFRLGRHLITLGAAKEYELNEAELKELKGKGPQAWIKEVTQAQLDAMPSSNKENKEMQDLKKKLVDRVELNGEESLEDLKAIVEDVEMYDALVLAAKEKGLEVSGEESIEDLEALLK